MKAMQRTASFLQKEAIVLRMCDFISLVYVEGRADAFTFESMSFRLFSRGAGRARGRWRTAARAPYMEEIWRAKPSLAQGAGGA